eukprot:g29717.t1
MELAALSDSQIGLLIVLRSERKSRKVGTQKWSSATAKTLATITTGLMITSVGELKFELYGFIMQCTALLSEGLRINLLEMLLKSILGISTFWNVDRSGYKLNPLSSVMVFAPVASAILLCIGLATDADAVSLDVIHNIGEIALLANAVIAASLRLGQTSRTAVVQLNG